MQERYHVSTGIFTKPARVNEYHEGRVLFARLTLSGEDAEVVRQASSG
jgi:hypothetical protein